MRVLLTSLAFVAFSVSTFGGPSEIDRAQSILRQGLDSKDPQLRLQAVVATSMLGRSKFVSDRLTSTLSGDKDTQVRIAAANALADLKAPDTVPALRKSMRNDPVPEVSFAAAKALYALNDDEGRAALEEIYDRKISADSNIVRKQARDFFAKFHTLRSSFLMVFSEGIGFVPLPGVGEGFSAITELLNDPDLTTRASVVLLLGRKQDARSTELLQRALKDKDWSVRAAAAQCIATAARRDLLNDLVPLLKDNKEKVRFRAAGAYLRLAEAPSRDTHSRKEVPRKTS